MLTDKTLGIRNRHEKSLVTPFFDRLFPKMGTRRITVIPLIAKQLRAVTTFSGIRE